MKIVGDIALDMFKINSPPSSSSVIMMELRILHVRLLRVFGDIVTRKASPHIVPKFVI